MMAIQKNRTTERRSLWLDKLTASPFGFTLTTERGKAYIVEGSTDLKQWNPVQTLRGTGRPARFIERRKLRANRQYYRVRRLDR